MDNKKENYRLEVTFGKKRRVGHKYTPVAVYSLGLLQHPVCATHRRLKVFLYKGTRCVSCTKEGVLLIEGIDTCGNTHLDLYTADLELMTVDHILPKSLGGRMHLNNLRPMCSKCNNARGNNINFIPENVQETQRPIRTI